MNNLKFVLASLILCGSTFCPQIAFASAQKHTTLTGQIRDQSGAAIANATVSLTQQGRTIRTASTISDGTYTLTSFAAGRYRVHVEAPGFAARDSSPVDFINGDCKVLNFALVIKSMEERVEVNADQPEAVNIEPTQNADQTALSGKALDTLPDDPDDLQADLQALAGPGTGPDGTQFIVDGFLTSRLPPKHSIREIRINQDPFSAEHDRLGSSRVEVFTNPASSKLHGQAFFNIDDSALNSRNPYAVNKPSTQTRRYGGAVTGPLSQKLAYSVDLERRQITDAAVIHAWILDSALDPVIFRRSVLAPNQRTSLSLRLDDQWSVRNSLTVRYSWFDFRQDNAGIGKIALPSNAYSSRNGEHVLQVSNTTVLSARAVNEFRAQYSKYGTTFAASDLSPTISVLDSFVAGGASTGPSHTSQNRFEVLDCSTLSKRAHTIRFGARVRTALLDDVSSQNFNGQFIFAGGLAPQVDSQNHLVTNVSGQPALITINSLERYRRTLFFSRQGLSDSAVRQLGGGASQFLLSSGSPAASLTQADLALFVEDSWRLRRNLMLGFGVRYEVQNHLADWLDLAPRMSLAWALPGDAARRHRVVLRFGSGLFYDRYGENLVLQTIRFNGINQHQIFINNPNFFPMVPGLSLLASLQPVETIHKADASLQAPRVFQGAAGLEFQLPGKTVVSLTYRTTRGVRLLRSRNTTAPPLTAQFANQEPLRPIGNVNTFTYESAGILNQHQFVAKIESHFSSDFSIFAQYTYGEAFSNTDGPNWFPANQYDLGTEYGRSATDIRHRFFLSGTAKAPFGLEVSPFVIARSGLPFNITTGRDTNGDSLFTDRPAMALNLSKPGVVITRFGAFDPNPLPGQRIIPRNLGNGWPYFTVSLRLSREFSIGRLMVPGKAERPYKLRFSVSARNLFNWRNPGLPIGNLASPLFGLSNSIAYSSGPDRQTGNNRAFDFQVLFRF